MQKLSTLHGSIACKPTLAAVSGNNGFLCDFISLTLLERSFGPLLLPLCFISFHWGLVIKVLLPSLLWWRCFFFTFCLQVHFFMLQIHVVIFCWCLPCLCILQGYVELTIFPTVVNLNRIKLNSKQCRIYRVRVNDLEAPFLYNDPTLEVCHHESKQWVDPHSSYFGPQNMC